jgi:hypothetical protein
MRVAARSAGFQYASSKNASCTSRITGSSAQARSTLCSFRSVSAAALRAASAGNHARSRAPKRAPTVLQ